MNYEESLDYLDTRPAPMGDFTTDNIKALLNRLNNPQNCGQTIHITGTNGKGSVASFLTNALLENNLSVGKFTSPYLIDIRESVQVDGEFISKDDFVKNLEIIKKEIDVLDSENIIVSSFEILTTIAYLYFKEKNVDFNVIEVGMGGRVDATNTEDENISVFCAISLDHTGILGKNLKEIAYQKGGLIRKESIAFSYPQDVEAKNELLRICEEENSEFRDFRFDEVEIVEANDTDTVFNFRNFKNVKTNLIGEYQAYNASVALMVLEYLKKDYNLDNEKIKLGIEKSRNIGRLELLSKSPKVLIDGSHNDASIHVLTENISKFNYDKLILGFSVLIDKNHEKILSQVEKLADKIVLTEIDNDRHTPLNDLKEEFEKITDKEIYAIEDRKKAAEKTLELAGENDLVLWCGSLYLIKDMRKILLEILNN
ncbi:bifunctional folylpolyglutamate synthase/dihydrofolate synthase [Peptoniphilus sp.]|jgi:dihydrofolate synthase/folylpolyglutamate synthase|uniref:bifunctional folylpolyglutamate synthase/dihydrofolate synthase n=1 Tax=Peptoniphilus sp. TaxID=1971214 RepID=UPI003D8E5280